MLLVVQLTEAIRDELTLARAAGTARSGTYASGSKGPHDHHAGIIDIDEGDSLHIDAYHYLCIHIRTNLHLHTSESSRYYSSHKYVTGQSSRSSTVITQPDIRQPPHRRFIQTSR